MQTFFSKPALRRYFLVSAVDSSCNQSTPHEVADVVEKRLAKWKATQQVHQEKAQVIGMEVAKTDKTG
jgi:hypothetical protein